ncbi:MAG: 4'-phosphopantetheinyl transferase family protein [Coraliomargaritaceae bacterium]
MNLSSSLEEICPYGSVGHCCLANGVGISPPAIDLVQTEGWAVARTEEFLGGRRSARTALDQVGAGIDQLLTRNEAGLPSWPVGYVGSISHCMGICAAVVGPTNLFPVLGLDVERVDRISERAAERVVHSLESSFYRGQQLHASILFSLKEAFYKAQYPRWSHQASFCEMALEVDLSVGSARIEFLSERLSKGMEGFGMDDFHFRFVLVDSYVISLCWLEV